MSLLREIQTACTDSQAPLADLLRRCKILAARLQHIQFKQWVDNELNGYNGKESLPEYRILKVQSFGDFSGPYGSGLNNAPIPPMCVPEEYRDIVDTWYCYESVSSLEELASHKPKSGVVISHWPADLIAYVGRNIYQRMSCIGAWRQLSSGAIVGILDTVRTRILSFALELETEIPDVGESGQINKPATQEKVTHIFNTYIAGSVGNLAAGGGQVSQQTTINVVKGNLNLLKQFLVEYGLKEIDLAELEQALAHDTEDSRNTEASLGVKTSEWLGKMVSKAAQGVWKIATTTATTVLTEALKKYLGMS